MKIVVTGAAGFLGSRVVERLRAGGHEVVAVDRVASGLEHRAAEAVIRIDLAHAELREVFEGAASLVHLAGGFPVDAVSLDGAADDIDVAMRVLEHAAGVGVRHALVLSTAMVYGAWPNNPIPLTEDAPVRPNSEFAFAVQRAELERRAFAWRAGCPGVSLAVLTSGVDVATSNRTGEPRIGFPLRFRCTSCGPACVASWRTSYRVSPPLTVWPSLSIGVLVS